MARPGAQIFDAPLNSISDGITMTHTLIPTDDWDLWRLERSVLSEGIPVRFINDDQMIDEYDRVYTIVSDGMVRRNPPR